MPAARPDSAALFGGYSARSQPAETDLAFRLQRRSTQLGI